MTDQYTQYPEHLKKRIEAVDKGFADEAKWREYLAALSTEDQARLEVKLDSLPPEERDKEIRRLLSGGPLNITPPPSNEGVQDPQAGADPNAPVAGEETETVESLKAQLDQVEQRYKTLQGMSKDSGEVERQNNILLAQIKLLQDQLYALQQHREPEKRKPDNRNVNVREALKEHYEALGVDLNEEVLEKMIKKDERLFEILDERADQRIGEVAQGFDSKLKVSAKETFDRDLLRAHPSWQTMWRTPEFQAFLVEEDGISGFARFDVINDAFARLDSRVVIRAFDLFTGKKASPASEPKPSNGGIDPEKAKNRIAPPKGSGGAFVPQNPINQMSPQEARKALTVLAVEYGKGQFKGSKEDYDKEYARLFGLAQPKGTG